MGVLKLGTFNIGLAGTKFLPENYNRSQVEQNLARIASMLNANQVDIAGLQEVDVTTNRSRGVDEPSFIRDALNWPTRSSRFQPATHRDGGEYGNSVLVNLSRPDISYQDNKIQRRQFPKDLGREDRSALAVRVDLKMPAGHARAFENVWFVTTHFDLPFTDWTRQLCAMLEWTRAFSFPTIICGDLNIVEKTNGELTQEYQLMSELFDKYGFRDVGPFGEGNETFARHATRKIDYFFLRDQRDWFRIVSTDRVRPKLGEHWLSDHWLVTCSLEY
ncbi:MAG: endonuclease/exonuclease/phosphatase family protein [Gammaproteobacteria bacterium]